MRLAIGLGSSMGDRRLHLERAVVRLARLPSTRLLAVSRWYRSPPMAGGAAKGWFLNGVALLETGLAPRQVLAACVALEEASGRRRRLFWADRPLDLDVLVAEGVRSDDPELVLPHPGVLDRAFVWCPLREVWPDALPGLRDLPADPPGIRAIGVFAHRRVPA